MGPLGTPELVLIFIVILLLFGAKKLPELAGRIGKSMGELKKARDVFEREIARPEEETRVKEAPGKEPRERDFLRICAIAFLEAERHSRPAADRRSHNKNREIGRERLDD